MEELKNLRINDGILYGDYDPESSGLIGSVAINVSDGEIVNAVYSEYDKPFHSYFNHAISRMRELVSDQESIPKEVLVMWY